MKDHFSFSIDFDGFRLPTLDQNLEKFKKKCAQKAARAGCSEYERDLFFHKNSRKVKKVFETSRKIRAAGIPLLIVKLTEYGFEVENDNIEFLQETRFCDLAEGADVYYFESLLVVNFVRPEGSKTAENVKNEIPADLAVDTENSQILADFFGI